MFKWACGEELVSVNVYSALQAVAGLSRGRSDAPDHAARQPVDWETVAKTIPFLSAPLQAVVRVQWACGARGGELLQMRPCDIDRDGEIWRFTPHSHKNQWRGKQRVILLGKDAQAILLPLLANRGPEEFVFNPRDSRDQARVRTAYDSNTYVRQVARASKRAGVSSWSPHQIRHAYATRVRRVAGIESARILLGHSSAVTSELYAVADEQSVLPIVLQLG
jgi:integrase